MDPIEARLRAEPTCRGCGRPKTGRRQICCRDCFKGRTAGVPALCWWRESLEGWLRAVEQQRSTLPTAAAAPPVQVGPRAVVCICTEPAQWEEVAHDV